MKTINDSFESGSDQGRRVKLPECSFRYVSSYENDELKPYVEPEPDLTDHKRIEALVCLGYSRADIEASLDSAKYDDVFATYLLLGRKSTDVRII